MIFICFSSFVFKGNTENENENAEFNYIIKNILFYKMFFWILINLSASISIKIEIFILIIEDYKGWD